MFRVASIAGAEVKYTERELEGRTSKETREARKSERAISLVLASRVSFLSRYLCTIAL